MELLEAAGGSLPGGSGSTQSAPQNERNQGFEQETGIAAQIPRRIVESSGPRAHTPQGRLSPSHSEDLALNASEESSAATFPATPPSPSSTRPPPQPQMPIITLLTHLYLVAERVEHDFTTNRVIFHLPPPSSSSTGPPPQPRMPITTFLTQLGLVVERVERVERIEHDFRTNRVIVHLPPPIDPQLHSAPSLAPPPHRDDKEAQHESLMVPGSQSQPHTRKDRTRIQGGAARKDNRRASHRPARKTGPRSTNATRTGRQRSDVPHLSLPSLITDSTATSALAGRVPASGPDTPQRHSPQPQQMILQEISQQDKAPADPENGEVTSPYISGSPFTMFDPVFQLGE